VTAAQAAVAAARTQVSGARTVTAAVATVQRIKVDIDDSTLVAPRAGRVQYRIAQPGEVLGGAASCSTWWT
jgi:HlyD family secretion protein